MICFNCPGLRGGCCTGTNRVEGNKSSRTIADFVIGLLNFRQQASPIELCTTLLFPSSLRRGIAASLGNRLIGRWFQYRQKERRYFFSFAAGLTVERYS